MFNGCDVYNRSLHDRKWPHRCGGRKCSGQDGHGHKFAIACIVQNTFNAYHSINNLESRSFKDNCIKLSNDLFKYATKFQI